jgi:hypothetical protein
VLQQKSLLVVVALGMHCPFVQVSSVLQTTFEQGSLGGGSVVRLRKFTGRQGCPTE